MIKWFEQKQKYYNWGRKPCPKCRSQMEYSEFCSTKNTQFWYCRKCTIERWSQMSPMVRTHGLSQSEKEREEELQRLYT